jgi:Luciferase-like monooxygenase
MTDTSVYTFGLDTFGDRNADASGTPLSHAQTIRNVVEEGVFAEQAGVDFFGIGEHHTDYFPMPAGDVALAAIAARTSRIRLGSAVTVLSSDDPVRVFQRYSTLNAISSGRARGHPRPRFEHRVIPAVRLRPRRLRDALRREGHAVR